ncbi:MAG: DegT/DnrJ/EryC1/StrS family aminotransferase, partial [Candidatus Sericytochromatia bacterium]
MTIPMLDLSRIHAPLEAELTAAFSRVLQANSYILGAEVSRFEAACAEYLGVGHAIGVSSGSDALLLALMVLGIGPGDEVICPSYTFFATAGAVARLGATPVFVDSNPDTHNWELAQVIGAVTERTRAVIPVHLFGLCAEMAGLMQWAEAHDIVVIEDVAQSMGATWHGQMAGSIGHFGCHSFFPSKNLGGFGDGGLLTCKDEAVAETARVLRAHGAKPKYHHHYVGGNFRLDALQAALLGVKLPHLESWIAQRRQ